MTRRESEVSLLLREIRDLKEDAGLGHVRFTGQTRLILDLANLLEQADEAGSIVPVEALTAWASRAGLDAVIVWRSELDTGRATVLFEHLRPPFTEFDLGKLDLTALPSPEELSLVPDRTIRVDLEDVLLDAALIQDDAITYADFQVVPLTSDGSIVLGAAKSDPGDVPTEPLLLAAGFALRTRMRRIAAIDDGEGRLDRYEQRERSFLAATQAVKYAGLADHQTVISRSLAELAAAFELDTLEWWRCDERRSVYVLEYSSRQSGDQRLDTTVPYGQRSSLDQGRMADPSVLEFASSNDSGPMLEVIARTRRTADGSYLLAGTSAAHPDGLEPIARIQIERISQLLDSVSIRLEQERRYLLLFASSPLPIAVRDSETQRLISCNQAFRRFTGLDDEAVVAGMGPAEYVFATVDDLPEDIRSEHAWMFDVLDDLSPSGPSRAVVFRGALGLPRIGVVTDAHIDASANLVATTVLDVTDSARSERSLRERLTRDDLTGALSRPGLREQFERMMNARRSVVVVVIDVDRFASINHAFGFAFGDELLRTLASRVRVHADGLGFLARLAGNQFAMILRGPLRTDRLDALITRIIDDAAMPVRPPRSNTGVAPSVSIGITTSTSVDDFDRALTRAEGAMRISKSRGGRTATRSDFDSTDGARLQLSTEAELFRAMEHEELRVFFQPIVDLTSQSVIGAEALVRWQHPTKGLLPAGAFIQTAIDVGLEEQITNFVLPMALRSAEGWQRDHGPLYVSVNLATSQMRKETDVVAQVDRALSMSGLRPDALRLEVTETAMIRDLEQADAVLQRLRALGVRIFLDDFGAGYSALSYLRQLSIDGIKIDRSFVTGLGTPSEGSASESEQAPNRVAGTDRFVRLITFAAELLDLDCIAEGIESEFEAEQLIAIGVRSGQGYFYAPPMPDRGFREFLDRQDTTSSTSR